MINKSKTMCAFHGKVWGTSTTIRAQPIFLLRCPCLEIWPNLFPFTHTLLAPPLKPKQTCITSAASLSLSLSPPTLNPSPSLAQIVTKKLFFLIYHVCLKESSCESLADFVKYFSFTPWSFGS